MRNLKGEIIFDNRNEALEHVIELRELGITLYICDQCGISFGSLSPSITDHGIICMLCAQASNVDAHCYRDEEYDDDRHELFTDDELLKMI